MKNITRRQIIFLLLYPVLHCALSFVFLMMALSRGIFPRDGGDPPVTFGQEIASAVGRFMLPILVGPLVMARSMGVRLLGSDWLWIALLGVLYGVVFLAIYRLFKRSPKK